MIAPMEKLVVAGPKRLSMQLLGELQKAGVVHLDTLRSPDLAQYRLSSDEEQRLKGWEGIASSAEHTMAILGFSPSAAKPFSGSLEEAQAKMHDWAYRAETLGKEQQALQEEIETIHLFASVAQKFAQLLHGLDRSPFLKTTAFLVENETVVASVEAGLRAALQERFALASEAVDGKVAVAVVVLNRDLEAARSALSRLGLSELRFPGVYGSLSSKEAAARMQERSRIAPEELQGIKGELVKLGSEAQATLLTLWTRAKDEAAQLRALSDLAGGRFGFALMGWVPVSEKPQVESALGRFKDQVVYAFEEADEHHEAEHVPVTLQNPAWAKPFELLHGFLNTPKYGGYDPTINIALFFPLFFGMVVGDMGLALLFAYFAWFFAQKARQGQNVTIPLVNAVVMPAVGQSLSRVLTWMTASAMVWGFLYGEVFGTLFERLQFPAMFGLQDGWRIFYPTSNPETYYGLIPIIFNRLDVAQTSSLLIVMCLVLGIVQLFYAFGLRAYMGYRHHHTAHMWEGIGYLAGLTGIVGFAYTFLTGQGGAITTPLLIAGLLVFAVAMVQVARSLGAIMGYLVMPIELLGKGGQILSYIRIYAVGLAGAVLYKLANDAGFALADQLGFIGILLGLLVAAIMFLLITLITIMGHVLQPVRLLWIEFGNNFGFFEETGRAYRPFKSVRND